MLLDALELIDRLVPSIPLASSGRTNQSSVDQNSRARYSSSAIVSE